MLNKNKLHQSQEKRQVVEDAEGKDINLMDRLSKVLFPLAAIIVTISAVTSQDWLRLGIAVLFVMATIRVYRKNDEGTESGVDD